MSDQRDVVPVNSLKGMSVLSLATGNKLGQVEDVFVDPVNGLLSGITIAADDGVVGSLEYDHIYSFGRDAIMAKAEESVVPLNADTVPQGGRNSTNLLGTKVITESGEVLGRIANIFVTLKPPPAVVYEIRQTLLDKLLGRGFYIPASAGYALSDDSERLLVPESTIANAAADINQLTGQASAVVRSFSPAEVLPNPPADEGDETIVRLRDEDETVVRLRDEDDTVVRRPRKAS